MTTINIGIKIRELRLQKGLSQEKLANLIGVSKQRVSQIETGGYDIGFNTLREVLYALDHDILIIKIPKL